MEKGIYFVASGFVFISGVMAAVLAFAPKKDSVLFLLWIPILLFGGIGIFILRNFVYKIEADKERVKMFSLSGESSIYWNQIKWYKYFALRNKFGGGANIYVLLKYTVGNTLTNASRKSKQALMLLSGDGPPVGLSTKEYKTVLDSYSPDKRKL